MSSPSKLKPCGGACKVSTGICGRLTFGTGKLDDNGYWERPCRPCAESWEQENSEVAWPRVNNIEHQLKIWPKYFRAILAGNKPFEVRKNDRNFHLGDILWLLEFDPDQSLYTGRDIKVRVTYITRDAPGLNSNFCIMGIKPLEKEFGQGRKEDTQAAAG